MSEHPFVIVRRPLDTSSLTSKRQALREPRSPDTVLEIVGTNGYISYRRADDARGVRSVSTSLESVRSVTELSIDLGEAVRRKMLELAAASGGDGSTENLVRRFLIPAVDALQSPEDGVLRPAEPALSKSRGTQANILLLHGTFSSPLGSFAALSDVLPRYDTRVYAHRTLQKSPIANAIDLAQQLGELGIRGSVILVSHSRGGLIGDLLARKELTPDERRRAYTALDKGDEEDRAALEELCELDRVLHESGRLFTIERFIRVAAPAAGTSLASDALPRMLERSLNSVRWMLRAVPDALTAVALEAVRSLIEIVLLGVVRHSLDYRAAPGLAAMNRVSPLVRVLAATPAISVPTTCVGARLEGAWWKSWRELFWKGASSALGGVFDGAHDIVVDSRSMTRGVPRTQGYLDDRVTASTQTWHLNYFDGETRDVIREAMAGPPAKGALTSPASSPIALVRTSSEPVLPSVLLFPDRALREWYISGELTWPSVSALLRSGPVPLTWTPGPLRRGAYASLEARATLLLPEDPRPNDVLVVAHGSGIVDLANDTDAEALAARALYLGRYDDLTARRTALEAELAPILGVCRASDVAGHVVPVAPPTVRAPGRGWLTGVDAPPHSRRSRASGGRSSGFIGASDHAGQAAIDPMPTRSRVAPTSARGARLAPLDSLPSDDDLVDLAIGASCEIHEEPIVASALELGVLHGAPHALEADPAVGDGLRAGEPTVFVLFQFAGDDISGEAEALEQRWRWAPFSERKRHRLLPPPGGVVCHVGPGDRLRVVHAGLPSARDVRPIDVTRAVEAAVVEAALTGPVPSLANGGAEVRRGWSVSSIAIPVLGADPFDALSIDEAVEAAVAGVAAARERLRAHEIEDLPRRVTLVARHEDVAVGAGHTALALAAQHPESIFVGSLRTGNGYFGKRPVRMMERSAWKRWRITCDGPRLNFEVDDGRSVRRSETKSRPEPPGPGDDGFATEIHRELLPGALRDPAVLSDDLVLELDGESAAYPWELVRSPGQMPFALRRGLVRQLVGVPRALGVPEVVERRALVIGDPAGTGAQQLPGAAHEARDIAALLESAGVEVNTLLSDLGTTALKALDQPHAILHIAAHGFAESGGGVLIGGRQILRTSTVESFATTPGIVFLNCCESGTVGASGPRALEALAAAFMARGVRAFIGAAWPVSDDAARHFAATFYEQMLAGVPFGRSVQQARARTAARFADDSTWGAYQCYGDPDLVLRVPRVARPPRYVLDREAHDETVSLLGELQTQSRSRDVSKRARARLEHIRAAITQAMGRGGWGMSGAVQERLGMAYLYIDDEERAIEAWSDALSDRTTRLECLPNLFDLQSRRAFRAWCGNETSALKHDIEEADRSLASIARLLVASADVARMAAQAKVRALVVNRKSRIKQDARKAYDAAALLPRAEVTRIAAERALITGKDQALQSGSKTGHDGSARRALPLALTLVADASHTTKQLDVPKMAALLETALDGRAAMLARATTADLFVLAGRVRKRADFSDIAAILRQDA